MRGSLPLAVTVSLLIVCIGTASAEAWRAADGQPFCVERDHLQEWVLALLQSDREWLAQLSDCTSLRVGMKIAVIEKYPSESDIGYVAKVRVFGRGASVVGYTLKINE